MMSDIYESSYGIFNHLANAKNPPGARRPLAGVAFHKGEDFTKGTLLEDSMRVFRDLPIKDIFGLNYVEFMKLPVDIADMMVKMAREKREKESKAAAQAEQALHNATREQRAMQAKNLSNKKIKDFYK